GVLYTETKRPKDAEDTFSECLAIRRGRLATGSAPAYHHDIAETLGNMGILFMETQQFEKAENVFKQALDTDWQLIRENSSRLI
ncbi:MAG TPA: tetratricopeptide repeat protein, partial [Terriglobales bacterium]